MNRADLALLLICAIWGTTFALLREALKSIHPFDLMALRFTLGTLILGGIYAKRLWPLRRRWLVDGGWLGLLLVVAYLAQVIGLATTSASRSAFITSMSVVFVPILAFTLGRARLVVGELVGVLLAFGGLVLFSADAGFSLRPGELWTLLCAFVFAVAILVTNAVGGRSPAIPLSVTQMAIGAAVGWVLVAARGGLSAGPREIPWGILIYLATFATAFVIAVQTWALARTSTVKAAVLFTTEPIFAALFAAGFFGERMTGRELAGAALILAGVIVSELWRPALARLGPRPGPGEAASGDRGSRT